MKKIAITGNIGCGKSWVCTLFERLGIPVFYSDPEAKRLYYRADIREAMMQRFGTDIYLYDGQLDKQRLSSYIFNDLEAMYEIFHMSYLSKFPTCTSIFYVLQMKKLRLYCYFLLTHIT